MSGSTLQNAVPLALVAIGFGLIAVLDDLTDEDVKAYQAKLSAFASTANSSLSAAISQPSAFNAADLAPSSQAVTADAVTPLAKALALSTVRPHIKTYLPEPAEGWTQRETRNDDYRRATGVAPIVWEDVNPQIASLENQMMQHLSAKLETPHRDRGLQRAAITYQNGDDIILLSVTYTPHRVFEGPDGGAFLVIKTMMRDLCTSEYGAKPYTIQGLPFEESPIAGSANARRIEGFLGDQIDIAVITNTPDAPVVDLLGRLDIGGLNRIIQQPVILAAATTNAAVSD